MKLTIDQIADFCEFKDCTVTLGDPEAGFIHVDGTGRRRPYNYGRFLSFRELGAEPLRNSEVVERATVFKIRRGSDERVLNRHEFETEWEDFLRKAGV